MMRNLQEYLADLTPRKRVLLISSGILILLMFLLLLYMLARDIELKSLQQGEVRGDLTGRFEEPRTVTLDGITYQYRKGLTTILLMGIDQTQETASLSSGFRNGGQADFLLLLLLDAQAKTITPIQIDRDTMAEITVLGVLGNEAGTRTAQICLSHGFGDGKAQSCGYTVDAVRKLLFGIDIDFYLAVNLDAISAINDALGGVTVTLQDDFTALDPAMQKGATLTLQGDQAEYFTRNRQGIGIGTNEARMARQREYLAKAGELLQAMLHTDQRFVGQLLDDLGDSLLTNMKKGRIINEFYGSKDYKKKEIVTPSGNYNVAADGFMEFHADIAALERLVLQEFYTVQAAS